MDQRAGGAGDSVVDLCSTVLGICSLVSEYMAAAQLDALSPQVATFPHVKVPCFGLAGLQVVTTLLWFLRRWSRVYLMLQEKDYTEIRRVAHNTSID